MALDLAVLLRDFGVQVVEESGWRTREREGTFSPVGQMNHHTAGGLVGEAPSLNICKYGRAGIPGPLCNGLICRKFHLHLISDGRANDSGMGRSNVLYDVRRDRAPVGRPAVSDDINGNPWFYDWEFENDGITEPWDDRMVEVGYKINHALCSHFGWSANRCIAHFEWTRRKPDPRGWIMSNFRAEVARRLVPVPAPPGGTVDPVLQKGATGQHVRILQGLLIAHAEDLAMWFSAGKLDIFVDGEFGDMTKAVLGFWAERTGILRTDGVADQPVWDWLKRTQ